MGSIREQVYADDREDVAAEIEDALATDGNYEAEFRMFDADDDVRWVLVRGRVVAARAGDGKDQRMIGVHHDITDRKEREQELREVTNQLEAVIDTVDAGIFLKDLDGRYQLFNETAREMLGLDPEMEVVGRTSDDLFDGARAEQFTADDQEVIETGEPIRREEVIPGGDGERTHLTIKSPVDDDSGEVTGICAVSTDISEQVAARAELERQNERLGEFANVVSHDLRNPLRLATGRLELAMEECDSEHLAPIDYALARMDDIIENVLQLAREGRDIGATEAVALEDAARTAWTMTASDAERATLDVRTDADWRVKADADRLHQLLENLFRNAIEHAGPDVTVTVGALDGGFYVADTGPGIPAEAREDVFDMGYSSTESGTGFGLSIVEQIVDAHGWDIRVTEGADGGARFEVRNVERPS